MTDVLAAMDATDQAALVASGEVRPDELVEAAAARIEALDPQLNAVIHRRLERAVDEARAGLPDGPFTGVPLVIKDLDGFVAGEPYHAGSRLLKDVGHVATADSHIVTALRRAGLVVVGKTNTPELGLLPTTEPLAYGPTRNPWDTERSTGGSSGGSAAAVASGMVPLGHAGDGGGSIRIPSSQCGLVGLKPSRGRHSFGPEAGEGWGGLVGRMLLARSVRDSAAMLQIIQGALPGDPYRAPPPARPYPEEVGADPGRLRVGLTTEAPDGHTPVHPSCAAAAEAAARLLESLGHDLEASCPEPWRNPDQSNELTAHFFSAYGSWAAADVDRLAALAGREPAGDDLEPVTWALAELGRQVTATSYLAAIDHFHATTRRMAAWWAPPDLGGEGFDLLVTPTLPELPPPLGEFAAQPDNPMSGLFRAASMVPFVAPFNITGQPALSLPLGWSDEGLPVGVQLVAAYGREDLLLRVAAQLEAARPWTDRRPPVHA